MRYRGLLSAILVVAALVMGGSHTAKAMLVNGWNFFSISECFASSSNGIPFIFVFNTVGDSILITDPLFIPTAAKFCVDGNGFFVNLTLPRQINAFFFEPGLS